VVVGQSSALSVTIPLGSVWEAHAVPLASSMTPADELVVSSAKQGTAVDGQVRPVIKLSPDGTVSFNQAEALEPLAHLDPVVVLQ